MWTGFGGGGAGGRSVVLYGPWDLKKVLSLRGGGRGSGMGWLLRYSQADLTIDVRQERLGFTAAYMASLRERDLVINL